MAIAITREVSESLQDCQLTYLPRSSINLSRAREEHHQYENCLVRLGCEIHRLPEEPDLPDAVFIEDTALVIGELAVITRPGASSRRAETPSVAKKLENYRDLRYINPPGTLEGGDLLLIGRVLYAGISNRSNLAGIEQLQSYLSPHGYSIRPIKIRDCLHLKSAVSQVAERVLLINPNWVEASAFGDFELVEVDPSEPFGANALLINHHVLYPLGYQKTLHRLEKRGIEVEGVDITELAKAEGGVTCCSLIFRR